MSRVQNPILQIVVRFIGLSHPLKIKIEVRRKTSSTEKDLGYYWGGSLCVGVYDMESDLRVYF